MRPLQTTRFGLGGRLYSSRVVGVLLLTTLTRCDRDAEAPREAGGFVLAQAVHVQLGMTWPDVQAVRPGVFLDSPGAAERVTETKENAYYFGRSLQSPGDVQQRPGAKGRLVAVVMDELVPAADTAQYKQSVCAVRKHWEGLTKREPQVLQRSLNLTDGDTLRREVLIWRTSEVTTLLEYDVRLTVAATANRLRRAVVLGSRVPTEGVIGYPLPKDSTDALLHIRTSYAARWCT